jgi:hypothetical protein
MAAITKLPRAIEIGRSQLRQDQSSVLRRASGDQVIVVRATSEDEEKYIVDKGFFEDLLKQLRSAIETLEITADTKLFSGLLAEAETIDEDLRLGKLRSFEEVTEED